MAYQYTQLELDQIVEQYLAGKTCEELFILYPTKSVASIRMRLVKLGVYVAKSKSKAQPAASAALPPTTTYPATKAGSRLHFRDAFASVGLATI